MVQAFFIEAIKFLMHFLCFFPRDFPRKEFVRMLYGKLASLTLPWFVCGRQKITTESFLTKMLQAQYFLTRKELVLSNFRNWISCCM